MDRYIVRTPQAIFDQMKSIKNYIQDVLFTPAVAQKTSQMILEGLRSLESFPEHGFDADEKVGRPISKLVKICRGFSENIQSVTGYLLIMLISLKIRRKKLWWLLYK